MPINGTVQATGEFAPSSSGDTYAILDAKYMRDGFRNVNTIADLDTITADRRIAGMVVGVSGGTDYYKLNPEPWSATYTTNGLAMGMPLAGFQYRVAGDQTALLTVGLTITVSGQVGVGNNNGSHVLDNVLYDIGSTSTYFTSPTFNMYFGESFSTTITVGYNFSNWSLFTSDDIYVTGATLSTGYTLTLSRNDNNDVTVNLAGLASDVYILSGVYDENTGVVTFTNSTGGTFNVSGFTTGMTESYWTGNSGTQSIKALNDTNITASGTYSVAEGENTTALGYASHAEGGTTTASGNYSHSEGDFTRANGGSTHAEGSATIANGEISHAEGYNTRALGNVSHAEGQSTTASGQASHAEGNSTQATGLYSHAEGISNIASGVASHAEGGWGGLGAGPTQAIGNSAHAEGLATIASGDFSHAEGNATIASGYTSHAEGQSTTASLDSSHAEGAYTTALGYYSHAEGQSTIASGDSSHAEGYLTVASGTQAHAEGYNTLASGASAHAEGDGTTAGGNQSHAGGSNTVASGDYSFVHGSGSTAGGYGTIVLGNGITGLLGNTTYVENFNVKNVASFNDGTGQTLIRQRVGSSADTAMYMFNNQVTTPTSSNWTIIKSVAGGATYFGATALGITTNGTTANPNILLNGAGMYFTQPNIGSSTGDGYWFTQSVNTGQASGVAVPGFRFQGASRQWLSGNIINQRESYFSQTTYSFLTAATITNAYGMFVEAPLAGSLCTITNNYGLGVSGNTIVYGSVSATTYLNLPVAAAASLSAVTAVGNTTTDDIEITDFNKGIILRSPNNTRWRITVDNSGSLITTSI